MPQRPSAEVHDPPKAAQTEYSYAGQYHPEEGASFSIRGKIERNPSANEPEDNGDRNSNTSINPLEADLLAQERMAHWTLWIGIFTAAGLAAIILTLAETQEVTRVTRDVGIAQVRAYISVLDFEWSGDPTSFTINKGHRVAKIGFSVNARNDGQTPARNVKVYSTVTAVPTVETARIGQVFRNNEYDFHDVAPGNPIDFSTPGGPIFLSEDEARLIASGEMFVLVEFGVEYDDVSTKRRSTQASFRCRWSIKGNWDITKEARKTKYT